MKKEIILNFIFTILISLIMFIQNKYFIQYMGIEKLGLMKLFTQLFQYLNIVELGLGSASSFALYKPLAEKNIIQISIILSTINRIYTKISFIILFLGIMLTPLIPYFIEMNKFSKKIYIYWILYVINTTSTYLYIKYIILFTANQEFIYVRFIQSVSKISFQVLQIFLIIKYNSFIIYILLLLMDNIIQFIFFKLHYKKYYFYIQKTNKKYLNLNKDIKNLFWHKMGSLVVFNTDLILISKFVSLKIVGIYASYQLIVQMIMTLVGAVVNVIRPKIGRFVSLNSNKKIYIKFQELNILFLISSLFFSYMSIILMNHFVELWLGKEIKLPKSSIILISINILIRIFRNNIDIFKESCGYFDDIQSPILESIINLISSIILGKKFGLNGIILGTIISNLMIIIIYKPILVLKRCFNKGKKEYIKLYLKYFILISISIIFLKNINKYFLEEEITNWIEWIKYSIKMSIISGVIIFIVFLLDFNFRNIIKNKVRSQNEKNN